MTFSRSLLILAAIIAACVGFTELRLKIQCPEPLELSAETLPQDERWLSSEPLWAKFEAFATPLPPFSIASETGNARGACLVLSSPKDPQTILAILLSETSAEARQFFAREGTVEIEGLTYHGLAKTRNFLQGYLARSGLRFASDFRLMETDRTPMGLAGLAGIFFLAILLATLAFLANRDFQDRLLQRLRRLMPERVLVLHPDSPSPRRSAPANGLLSEDAKLRVKVMISEVWDKAAATASR